MQFYFIDNLLSRFSPDVAIDLGTANNPVLIRGKGILTNEPSYMARVKSTKKVIAVGHEAKLMVGRTPDEIEVVRPLQKGVIADFDIALEMIRYLLRGANTQGLLRPRVMLGIPSDVTDVEKMAAAEAAHGAGARVVYLIQQPLAAAIGAGLDVLRPRGSMILDIGGGTSEVSLVSLGGVVQSGSLRIAGDDVNEALISHVRHYHNFLIGENTAEEIKIDIGCAVPTGQNLKMAIKGRNLNTGMPGIMEISEKDVAFAVNEIITRLIEMIHSVLENTPPELASDLAEHGITMCGGGSLLRGLDRVLSGEMGVPFHLVEDAMSCVVLGQEKLFSDRKLMNRIAPERF